MNGLSEGKDRLQLEMYGARDYLDALPQSMANSSYTTLHRGPFYALVLHLMLLH